MTNLENKEKNLNNLIEKLSNMSNSYSHDELKSEELKKERDYFLSEKNKIENKHIELLREQKYLKNKLANLEKELSKKTELQEKFSREIDDLSQETEELVEEIDKWQT
jgi:chromosome segregation ATPase|tara:strand:+ start:134 stop:457 length:324 start_codon:yes stop_codon:yes gene_type:complete